MDYIHSHSLDGTFDSIRIYLICYCVLDDGADPRANEVLAEAAAYLQTQVEAIDDAVLRASFLENVPAHRELLALQ